MTRRKISLQKRRCHCFHGDEDRNTACDRRYGSEKGDILVSGRAEILNDDGEVAEYIYPGADADIIAEVNFYYEDEINISYQDKIKQAGQKIMGSGSLIIT